MSLQSLIVQFERQFHTIQRFATVVSRLQETHKSDSQFMKKIYKTYDLQVKTLRNFLVSHATESFCETKGFEEILSIVNLVLFYLFTIERILVQ